MFGLDMAAVAGQIEAFKDQSERAVQAIEEIRKDIQAIKKALNIPDETTTIDQEPKQ